MSDIEFLANLLKEPEYPVRSVRAILPDKPRVAQQFDMILSYRGTPGAEMQCIFKTDGERCEERTGYLFQGLPFCWSHLAPRFEYFINNNGALWRENV